MAPAEVRASLSGGLAYNTVHTSLTRLCDKGLVVRERTDRGIGYRPAKDHAQHVADEMRAALARGTDRGTVLLRFITSLDPDDEAALRALLERRAGG
jgi:predicted transcriptional regulator